MANSINSPYYLDPADTGRGNSGALNSGLPVISEGLDSVRAYQFEIHFELPSVLNQDPDSKLTLAAKQVTAAGFSTEDIEVHRVNDKVFYPGKASPESITVTFDNFYQPKVANTLWSWFSTIYDPMNGKFYTEVNGSSPQKAPVNGWKSQRATIVSLDAQGSPLMETRLFGVYPKAWKTAEFNYSTNEFHTIEMEFRYDFMEHVTFGAAVGSALTSP
jgi:hypothetical protein